PRGPPAGGGGPGSAGRAAPGRPPAAGPERRPARRDLRDGGAGPLPGGRRRGELRQRRPAPGGGEGPRGLARGGRPRFRRGPQRPPGRRPLPSPLVVRALGDALAGHGRSRDELPELLEAQNAAPAVSLVMRPGLTDLDELIDHGASRGRLSVFAASWPSGDPGGMDLVLQGRVGVQDEGSQLAALALALGADDLVLAEDAHWLDLCAGPGGKTALLGGLTVDHDADLLAVELQQHRTELVDRAVAPLQEAGCEITTRTADGTTIGAE